MQACPGDDTMTMLVCGQLDLGRTAELRRHVTDCESCRAVVSGLLTHKPIATDALGKAMFVMLAPGTIVGRYQIQELLGAGGMGVVYAAYDPELERKVALKVLYPIAATPEDVFAIGSGGLLRHESQVMAKLRHPNVAAVYDVGSYEGRGYFTMELVEGTTLRAWCGANKPIDEIIETFRRAGEGLAAAHAAGIVHCDFKPDNVLIDTHGRPLITDFGLAHVADTIAGGIAGTPAYMAPERYDSDLAPDERGDIYAFCVSLHEVIYGERPEPDGTPTGDAPSWINAVIARGIAADLTVRFQSMPELLAALQPPRKRGRAIATASFAMIAVAGAAGWTLTRQHADAPSCNARSELTNVGTSAQTMWTATPEGRAVWGRIQPAIDDYAHAWVTASDRACKAPPSSAVVAEAQARCLRAAKVQLDTVVATFDKAVVTDTADRAVAHLPALDECGSTAATRPVPANPMTRVEVGLLRDEMTFADAQNTAGHFAVSMHALDQLEPRAKTVGYKPVLAEISYLRALNMRGMKAKSEDTTAAFRAAAAEAEAAGNNALAVDAWTSLAFQASEVDGDWKRGREYATYATAALERAGASPRLEATLWNAKGRIALAANDLDESRRAYEAAAVAAKDIPKLHIEALSGLASIDRKTEHLSEALAKQKQLLEMRLALYGKNHPEIARSYTQLGDVEMALRKFDDALADYHKAEDAAMVAFGPQHLNTQITAHNLGGILRSLHRPAEAEVELRRAIEISLVTSGADHPYTAKSEDSLAMALMDQGKNDEAVALLRHVVAVDMKAYGPGEIPTLIATNDLAIALRHDGKLEESLAQQRLATAGFAIKAPGTDDLAQAYEMEGMVLGALHRNREAAAALDKADAVAKKLEGNAPRLTDIAEIRASLK
ncbi:MAG: serine/threonine-protein kinase [Kofleriaceae bacterium]